MKRYIGVLLCITVLITCFVALPSLALTVSPQSMAIETTQAEIHHIGNGIMSCTLGLLCGRDTGLILR